MKILVVGKAKNGDALREAFDEIFRNNPGASIIRGPEVFSHEELEENFGRYGADKIVILTSHEKVDAVTS